MGYIKRRRGSSHPIPHACTSALARHPLIQMSRIPPQTPQTPKNSIQKSHSKKQLKSTNSSPGATITLPYLHHTTPLPRRNVWRQLQQKVGRRGLEWRKVRFATKVCVPWVWVREAARRGWWLFGLRLKGVARLVREGMEGEGRERGK